MPAGLVEQLQTSRASQSAELGIATRARGLVDLVRAGDFFGAAAALVELEKHVRVADLLAAEVEKQVNEAFRSTAIEAGK